MEKTQKNTTKQPVQTPPNSCLKNKHLSPSLNPLHKDNLSAHPLAKRKIYNSEIIY